ncbi:hypothetical protein ACWCOP_03990 [Maricaulaceae bacterium MS644]
MMTLERFSALCAAYGGDFERWPPAERDPGRALAQTTSEARVVLQQARLLDGALEHARSAPASDELARRIAASAPRAKRAPAPTPAWAALAAALALTVGLGAGWLGAAPGGTGDVDLYANAFGALDDSAALELLEDA